MTPPTLSLLGHAADGGGGEIEKQDDGEGPSEIDGAVDTEGEFDRAANGVVESFLVSSPNPHAKLVIRSKSPPKASRDGPEP